MAVGGYYPTQRCVRYDAGADAYVMSMEGFVYRGASRATTARPIGEVRRH